MLSTIPALFCNVDTYLSTHNFNSSFTIVGRYVIWKVDPVEAHWENWSKSLYLRADIATPRYFNLTFPLKVRLKLKLLYEVWSKEHILYSSDSRAKHKLYRLIY